MTTTMTEPDQQTDHAWDNRRLILASLAPRTTPRPARRSPAADPDALFPDGDTTTAGPKKPGLLTRAARGAGRAAAAGGRQFNKRVPPGRRAHTAILTAAVLVVLLVAVAGVNYLTHDVNPQAQNTTSTAPQPPAPNLAPINRDTIITGVHATDICPRDANYSDANRAVDGDLNTAWRCTRVKNKDGQNIQMDFGRQVTLSQIRVTSGFDATAPDGTDQWGKNRIVTKYMVYFPKELNRAPLTLVTNGDRDWRPLNIDPPATVSKLLIKVVETSDPPQSSPPTKESAAPTPDEVTTVAISEIQFIGIEGARPN